MPIRGPNRMPFDSFVASLCANIGDYALTQRDGPEGPRQARREVLATAISQGSEYGSDVVAVVRRHMLDQDRRGDCVGVASTQGANQRGINPASSEKISDPAAHVLAEYFRVLLVPPG